jgi:hypothetical protein
MTEHSDRPTTAPKMVNLDPMISDPTERRPWSMRKMLIARPINSRRFHLNNEPADGAEEDLHGAEESQQSHGNPQAAGKTEKNEE